MTRGNTGSAMALSKMAQRESARTPRGATTKLKKFIAEERGDSLMAVRTGSPQPQHKSSKTRFKVAFRASGVVFRHRSKVRLVGSHMIRVASVSIAGDVGWRGVSRPQGGRSAASRPSGTPGNGT